MVLTPEQEADLAESVALLDFATCSPAAADAREARRRDYPVHERDQLHAATAEGRQVAMSGRIAQGQVNEFINVDAAAQPMWLRRAVMETLLVWNRGWGLTCAHNPVMTRPEPVFAGSWYPRLVVCQRCTHVLGVPERRLKSRPCDNCSVPAPSGGPLRLSLACIQLSALCYSFALCPDCCVSLGFSQPVPRGDQG